MTLPSLALRLLGWAATSGQKRGSDVRFGRSLRLQARACTPAFPAHSCRSAKARNPPVPAVRPTVASAHLRHTLTAFALKAESASGSAAPSKAESVIGWAVVGDVVGEAASAAESGFEAEIVSEAVFSSARRAPPPPVVVIRPERAFPISPVRAENTRKRA
jgi:hypothetical protein